MVLIGWALVVNSIGLIYPAIMAIKQKHYVKRDDAVYCGLSLIVIAFGLIIDRPDLRLWVFPLYAFPFIQGISGIGLVVTREDWGKLILSGLASVVMGLVVLVAQILA